MKKILLKIILIIILININTKNAICKESTRPNIVFILTDDQRIDTVKRYMPNIYNEIFKKGTIFKNAYATSPICGPSRISIYTGLYASEHGMHYNDAKETNDYSKKSIARKLKSSGYFTGLIGKFHNTSNGRYSKKRKKEYDFWVSHRGGSARYYETKVNYNGIWVNKSGQYITDFWNMASLQFLNKAIKNEKPFFLTVSHNAPHGPALSSESYKNLYSQQNVKLNPVTYLYTEEEGKPLFVRNQQEMVKNKVGYREHLDQITHKLALNQLRALKSVDDGFKRLLHKLKKLGLYENTVFVFMSDNGLMWGEHCLKSKNYIYEEASHIPLAIYYPKNKKMFPQKTIGSIVANIDIAPTFANLAGLQIKEGEYSGISLKKIVKGKSQREGILLQGRFINPNAMYSAYHTKRYVYAQVGEEKEIELYDLRRDKNQIHNVSGEGDYKEIEVDLKSKFDEENLKHDPKSCYEKGCGKF